jgi:hypothetical protein
MRAIHLRRAPIHAILDQIFQGDFNDGKTEWPRAR